MRAIQGNHRVRARQKLAGIVTASVLALSVLGGGTASAAPPAGWVAGYGTDSSLPAALQPSSGASSSTVSAGNTVGFFEWLRNDGPSNIAQLFVNGTTSAALVGAEWEIKDSSGSPVPGRSGTCPTATPLVCSFGPLNATQTVYLVAAFRPASASVLNVTFDWNTTGIVIGGRNKSHGDSIPKADSVVVTTSGDADGDFNFDGTVTVETDPVRPGNAQQTSLTVVGSAPVGAAVDDSGSASLAAKCTTALIAEIVVENPWFSCKKLTTLTSHLEAGNGKTFTNVNGGPGINVIISFAQAPSQLNSANPFAYHHFVDASGEHAELVTALCAYDQGLPTNQTPCLTVGSGNVAIWVFHNGGMRN